MVSIGVDNRSHLIGRFQNFGFDQQGLSRESGKAAIYILNRMKNTPVLSLQPVQRCSRLNIWLLRA